MDLLAQVALPNPEIQKLIGLKRKQAFAEDLSRRRLFRRGLVRNVDKGHRWQAATSSDVQRVAALLDKYMQASSLETGILTCIAAAYCMHRDALSEREWAVLLSFGWEGPGRLYLYAAINELRRPRLYARRTVRRTSARTLAQYDEQECREFFRLNKSDVAKMMRLLQIPDVVRTKRRDKWSGEVAFLMFMRRLCTGCKMSDMLADCGRMSETSLCAAFNFVLDFLYHKYRHHVCGSMLRWERYVPEWASAIRVKIGTYDEHQAGQMCMFVDGTFVKTCRPSNSRLQRVMWSGYKHSSGMSYLGVTAPNGLLLWFSGPETGRHQDNYLVRQSGVEDRLRELFDRVGPDNNLRCFGDRIFRPSDVISRGFRGANITTEQKATNVQLSRARICVEWSFGLMWKLFRATRTLRCMAIGRSPVAKLCTVSAVLHNCYVCMNGSQTGKYFACAPPSIEHYLSS